MKQLLEDTRRIVRTRSTAVDGNEALGNLLSQMMESRGLKVQLQQVLHSFEGISRRQFNVIGVLGDPLVDRKTKKGLLLAFPMDTGLPGALDAWNQAQRDPFNSVLVEGRVVGLGASSGKPDFLCALRAIEKYREKKLKAPIYLVGLCGSEFGNLGARYLIKSVALNPKWVVVGSPTHLHLCDQTKASFQYKVRLNYQVMEKDAKGFNRRIDLHSFGSLAHSSQPSLGENAISQLLAFLQLSHQNGFDMRFTQLRGGEERTSVPDRALGQFFLSAQQFEDFKRFFRETVKAQGKEKAYRVELGGLGDSGIGFLPESALKSLHLVHEKFRGLAVALSQKEESSFTPPHSTVSLAELKGISQGLELTYDIRLLPGQEIQGIEHEFQAALKEISKQCPNMNILGSKEHYTPELNLASDHELSLLVKKTLADLQLSTDSLHLSVDTAASLFNEAGHPAVSFGAGEENQLHRPNESVSIEALEKTFRFYDRMIEKVCT